MTRYYERINSALAIQVLNRLMDGVVDRGRIRGNDQEFMTSSSFTLGPNILVTISEEFETHSTKYGGYTISCKARHLLLYYTPSADLLLADKLVVRASIAIDKQKDGDWWKVTYLVRQVDFKATTADQTIMSDDQRQPGPNEPILRAWRKEMRRQSLEGFFFTPDLASPAIAAQAPWAAASLAPTTLH